MSRFAEKTDVPVTKSRAEIEHTLVRYGATSFMSGWSGTRAYIAFEMQGRRIKFLMPVPDPADRRFTLFRHSSGKLLPRSPDASHAQWDQACRQVWRALLLVIKAKLEAVEAGISVFEDEFLAHIMLPDGRTVGEMVRPSLAIAYETGKVPPLLPDYSRGEQ